MNGRGADQNRQSTILLIGLIATSVFLGAAVAEGRIWLLVYAFVAACAIAVIVRHPLSGMVIALLIAGTIPIFIGTVAVDIGPLSLHWTDAALLALLAASAAAYSQDPSRFRQPLRTALVLCVPLLAVVLLAAMLALFRGGSVLQTGTALRAYAWYAALAAFSVTMCNSAARVRVRELIVVIAAFVSVLVIASNLVPGIGVVVSALTGSRLVALPGYDATIARLVLPGMTLVPLAFGLMIGELAYDPKARLVPRTLLAGLFAAAMLVTFARGIWLWTAISVLIVMSARVRLKTVISGIVAIGLLIAAILVADALIGESSRLPDGLAAMVSARIGSIADGDANVDIRKQEDRAVLTAVGDNYVLGVGPEQTLGVYLEQPNGVGIYTIHNAYYAVFGRFGLLGLLSLGWLIVGIGVLGFSALHRASGADAAIIFGLLIGFVRGVLSAWTQADLTNVTGIMVLTLCAGGIVAMSRAHDGGETVT